MASRRQVIIDFDARPDLRSSRLRGGKGAHLADMRALGLPVPPGFTITTTVARAFMEHNRLPARTAWQLERELERLERKTGKRFGDSTNPLLLSVRSGAEVSMPGMMDTILNLGMNDDIRNGLAASAGSAFADNCYFRFISGFESVMGKSEPISPHPREQLGLAIGAVLRSWDSERAKAYRIACGIPHTLGTAVTVQEMVFGNRDECSGTGVVFSRNPNTGERMLYGEFLACAQGEDVVSGSHTPMPITYLATWNADVYNELASYVARLEEHLGAVADVEFTIESGKLYLLQCRAAKLTAQAAATFAVHQQWDKRWSKEQAIQSLASDQLEALATRAQFVARETDDVVAPVIASGLAASPGAVVGLIATTSDDAIEMKAAGWKKVVLVRPETTPNDLPGMLAADAIVTFTGGSTSHAAVVARQLGKPAVVGVGRLPDHVMLAGELVLAGRSSMYLSVCGTTGTVYQGIREVAEPTRTKEMNILLKWVGEQRPAPRINFDAVNERVHIDQLCVDLYLLDAMAHAACGTALARSIKAEHQKLLVVTAERFACYLAIAVASELRHGHGGYLKMPERRVLSATYGIMEEYNRGDEHILSVLGTRDVSEHILFFEFAEQAFRTGSWSGSMGGVKWADIARAGHLFLSGTYAHGTFVDHVFDLRHNGGRLFDKHSMIKETEIAYSIRPTSRKRSLDILLDAKKHARTVSDLFRSFATVLASYRSAYSTRPLTITPSPDVLRYWEEGRKLNLWKEGAP